MMNISLRLLSRLAAFASLALLAGCADSGHTLGTSNPPDAGGVGGSVPTGGVLGGGGGAHTTIPNGGSPGTGGASTTIPTGGSPGTGGASTTIPTGGNTAIGGAHTTIPTGGSPGMGGATGGRGGSDAGAAGGDAAVGTCGMRGESCAGRSCCGSLICLSWSNPPSCAESYPPPADTGSAASDAGASRDAPASGGDSGCPVCPAMKCSYGSPVDSNGCTVCACNPPPDGGGGRDEAGCALPEGCSDAASTPCPATPPADGSACVGQSVCNYEDCPGTGHTQASCRSDKWVVGNGACGTVICLGVGVGNTCAADKVCLVHAGGALLIDCIDNPCGSGLVSADCSTSTTGCTPIFSTTSGLTYYCNTCPTGTCP